MTRSTIGRAALAALILCLAPRARADDQGDQFKVHVQKAKVHYDLGEYDAAAEEYIEAYRIKPVAGALFNIAQAYRQAGSYDKSRQFYRSFLREGTPDGKTKALVEKQIKELDDLIAKEEKTKRASPTGVQAQLTPPRDELEPPGKPAAPPPASATPDIDLEPRATTAPGRPASAPAATSTAAKPASASASATTPAAPPGRPAPATSAAPAIASSPVTPPPSAQSTVTVTPPPPAKLAVADTRPKPAPVATTAAPPAATRTDSTLETTSGGKSHTWAYVTGGVAVAALGAGAFFGVQAARADNELNAGAHTRADADSLISTSKSDHTLSAVLLAAGAAAAVGAGLLFFLPSSGPSGGAGASVGGHF